jgi:hypothetical protein
MLTVRAIYRRCSAGWLSARALDSTDVAHLRLILEGSAPRSADGATDESIGAVRMSVIMGDRGKQGGGWHGHHYAIIGSVVAAGAMVAVWMRRAQRRRRYG